MKGKFCWERVAMEPIIQKENITIAVQADSWQDAVRRSAQPLIDHGHIEPRYVDAILESTVRNGPYYVLAPEIAMPHAGPEDGVISRQISLLVLRRPVRFSEDGFDVRLVFTLAATDRRSHLDLLRALAALFSDEEKIAAIIGAKTIEDIVDILESG